MIILGIAFLSDASAALLVDGRLVAAVSEERLNRVKLWDGLPEQAIASVLEIAGITLADVDAIATHGLCPDTPDRAAFDRQEAAIRGSRLDDAQKSAQLATLRWRFEHESAVLATRTPAMLSRVRALAPNKPTLVYAHHHAHAATAYLGSPWDEALVLTADGWGEDGSAGLWHGADGVLAPVSITPTIDSLGYFYGSVTKTLGFVPQRHEGKVLGLAAYCRDPRSYPLLRSMVDYDAERLQFVGRMDRGLYAPRFSNDNLGPALAGFTREDIASATQRTLEEVVCAMISAQGGRARRLALAGGVFANVKLNQRLAELPNVDEIFVYPNMGDGGLCVGAAWLAHVELTGQRPEPVRTMYLGPDIAEADCESALAGSGFNYSRPADIQDAVAGLLAAGSVVARCTGRMEFGPRALGHRSILYQANDASANDWLNHRLGRSEFMPFAPASLADEADRLYTGLASCRAPAAYMAVTTGCTAAMKSEAGAAVHVDDTARPQLVTREQHPDLHRILEAYRARTGRSTVVNTSFNMHEEPIVCTAADAVRAFAAAGIPYLALGGFLVQAAEA